MAVVYVIVFAALPTTSPFLRSCDGGLLNVVVSWRAQSYSIVA